MPHGPAADGIPLPFRRRRRRPSRGFPIADAEYGVAPLTLHESEFLHVGLKLLVPDSACFSPFGGTKRRPPAHAQEEAPCRLLRRCLRVDRLLIRRIGGGRGRRGPRSR